MARQRFNVRQLTITGSKSAMAAAATTLDDNAVFMMQVSSSSSGPDVQLIKAQHMQNYFSDIDVDAVDSGEYSLVFIDPTGADSVTSGFDFKRDEDGNGAISWSPSSTAGNGRLKIVGDIRLDHDGAYIDWGDDQALRLAHVSGTTHKLILSGSSGAEFIQFGASGVEVGSSADGRLDLDAGTLIQMQGGAFDLDGTSYNVSGSEGMTMIMGGAYSLTGAGAFDIDVGGALTLDGSSITIGGDSDVAVDIDAAALNIDASGEMAIVGTAGVLLHSSEAAADAVIIKASNDAGGIDLIASGSNVALSIDKDSADFGSTIQVNVDNVTDASSKSTGALVVDGGVGVAKNLYVGGNLIVQGATTTVETTNMVVEDPLVQLGSASAGNVAADGDRGFILSLSGSANAAMFWDHGSSQFALARTSNTSADTEITVSDYSALRIGALTADDAATVGSTLQVSGRSDFDDHVDMAATLHVTGAITGDSTFQLDGAATLSSTLSVASTASFNSTVNIGDASSDLLTVNAGDVDFVNTPAILQTALSASGGDLLYVRDESAQQMKELSFAELGKYLSRGTSATATDSQGIKVGSDGSLELQYQEDFFVSGASNAGKTFALSGISAIATEVLDNSLAVYLNGQLQLASGSIAGYGDGLGDYSISSGNVVMRDAVDSDDVVIIRYLKK